MTIDSDTLDVLKACVGRTIADVVLNDEPMVPGVFVTFTDGTRVEITGPYDEGIVAQVV